jgi:DNA-binding transcriptional regulator GbsR (MarR family)
MAAKTMREPAEQLALALTRAGLQRMTARLLAAFLFTDQPGLTMGELAGDLGVSPGSVSAGVKTLMSVGLIEQIPAPGSRRDHYRMRDDAWPTLFSTQNHVIGVMQKAAEDGIAASGTNSVVRRRLEDMRDFYAFMLRELPTLIDRWQDHSSRRTYAR